MMMPPKNTIAIAILPSDKLDLTIDVHSQVNFGGVSFSPSSCEAPEATFGSSGEATTSFSNATPYSSDPPLVR